MEIKEEKQGNMIVLHIYGRIDTNTSTDYQSGMLHALQKSKNVSVDMEGVHYISSAGLRAILIATKTAAANESSLVFQNINDDVMNILEQSQFVRFMVIQ